MVVARAYAAKRDFREALAELAEQAGGRRCAWPNARTTSGHGRVCGGLGGDPRIPSAPGRGGTPAGVRRRHQVERLPTWVRPVCRRADAAPSCDCEDLPVMTYPIRPFGARPCTLVVCRGCCCGDARKNPGTDHAGQLARLRDAAAASGGRLALRTSDCLGP